MEELWRSSLLLLSVLSTCIFLIQCSSGAFVGVSFGTAVSNLPRPERVCDLLSSMGVNHVRLYDSSSEVLTAFAGSGIEVLVSVPNNAIQSVGSSKLTAATWVRNNVVAFLPNTNITGIVVGNEVLTDYTIAASLLVPAMKFIHEALIRAKLDRKIRVTSAHSSRLIMGAFPPSHAFFNLSFADQVVKPMLDFISDTDSYFMLNMNPLAIYEQSKQVTPIEYVLFQPNKGALDANTKLNYSNLFDALLDATFSAIAAMNYTTIPVVVGEAGWPWKGDDDDDDDASIQNAETYNSNLVEHVLKNKATPMRPGTEINTYIFELYNEDKKSGVATERFWGLFNVDQTPVYKVDVSGITLRDSTTNSSSSADGGIGLPKTWCVAKTGVSDSVLESALNWACGVGNADCAPIQQGGPCFLPNSVASHASYAFNSYYQRNIQGNGTCDFNGCAQFTNSDPSYNSCIFSSGSALNSIIQQNNSTKSSAGSNNGMYVTAAAAAFASVVLITGY